MIGAVSRTTVSVLACRSTGQGERGQAGQEHRGAGAGASDSNLPPVRARVEWPRGLADDRPADWHRCAVIGAEWPRLSAAGSETRRGSARERQQRKSQLKLLRTETEEFAASVERDLNELPTIEETDRR